MKFFPSNTFFQVIMPIASDSQVEAKQEQIRVIAQHHDIVPQFPSYREGFGVSIIEAAMMELPIICTDITGCNEIIENNVNGKLVKSKDCEGLYQAMEAFIINKTLINSFGEMARPMVESKYSQELVWKEAMNTYKQIVS